MSTKTMKFALAAVLAVGVVSAQADEDPIAAAVAQAAKTVAAVSQATAAMPEESVKEIQAAESAKNPAPTAKEMKNDAGVQAVMKMQDDAVIPAKDELPKTAEEQVKYILEKKNGIKIEQTKDRYINVVSVSVPMTKEPAKDKTFLVTRDLLCKKAVLKAKQQLVGQLGSIFDAREQNEIFGTNEVTKVVAGLTIPTKPIFGMTVLAQAEEWNGDEYRMAVAVVWSKGLFKAAKAITLGEKLVGKEGAGSTRDWLQNNDLTLMCGPRQHVNDKGERVFLGIATREVGVNSFADSKNKRAAQMSALSHLMFSIFSDVEGATGLESALDVFETEGEKADSKTEEALTDKIAQVIKGRAVEGAREIYSKEDVHPLSGKKMYISVYAVDSESVAAARVFIEEMVSASVLATLANKRTLGRHQGYQDQREAAEANTEEFKKGRAEGNAAIQKRVAPPKSRTVNSVVAPQKRDVKSTQGVFTGEGSISNDF